MNYDSRFGPEAQTPGQRSQVLEKMQQAVPRLRRRATAYVQQLYARYVAGELSWPQVWQAIEENGGLP